VGGRRAGRRFERLSLKRPDDLLTQTPLASVRGRRFHADLWELRHRADEPPRVGGQDDLGPLHEVFGQHLRSDNPARALYFLNRFSKALRASSSGPLCPLARPGIAWLLGLKKSQKFARSRSDTHSVCGSRQRLDDEVS